MHCTFPECAERKFAFSHPECSTPAAWGQWEAVRTGSRAEQALGSVVQSVSAWFQRPLSFPALTRGSVHTHPMSMSLTTPSDIFDLGQEIFQDFFLKITVDFILFVLVGFAFLSNALGSFMCCCWDPKLGKSGPLTLHGAPDHTVV